MVVQPQLPATAGAGGAVPTQLDKKIRKKREGPPRQPTAYNVFMKAELAKLKAEQPEIHHKEAFKIAAGRWADAPENPKNAKATAAITAAPTGGDAAGAAPAAAAPAAPAAAVPAAPAAAAPAAAAEKAA